MGLNVSISWLLWRASNGVAITEVQGDIFGDCLKGLVEFSFLKKELFNAQSNLAPHITICVNSRSGHGKGLARLVKDGNFPYRS